MIARPMMTTTHPTWLPPRPVAATPLSTLILTLALAMAMTPTAPARGEDRIKDLQTANIASQKTKAARPYHFGSQGPNGVFSNHASHTNRLIPVYVFGRKADLGAVTGQNSLYRDPEKVKALYGFLPENTVNPDAEYADQSDFYKVQRDAIARGVKHLFIVWFDGLDWPTTQAAAIARSGKLYDAGKGSGLVFQDYDAGGSARFGYYVTSPTHDKNAPDIDNQTVVIPPESLGGGYDPRFAGANPWTVGPLGRKAAGYLKGQSADAADRAAVEAAGGVLHAYTDSSTSAAEFVSGRKAYNSSINVTDDGRFVPTLFHELQAQGWKLGTVTSVPFNHASPAAMYAHDVDRDDYQDLARDMLGLSGIAQETKKDPTHPGLDVVLGAGFGQETDVRTLRVQGQNAVQGNLYLADADKAAIDVKNGGKYVVTQTTPGSRGADVLRVAAENAARSGRRLFGYFGSKRLNHLPYRTATQTAPAPRPCSHQRRPRRRRRALRPPGPRGPSRRGERIQPRVQRPEHRLVVLGAQRSGGGLADDPRHHARPQPLEHRHRGVAIGVVTMGGIDIVAQPHPRVGDPRPAGRQPPRHDLQRLPRPPVDRRLGPERDRRVAALQPRRHQAMVVVAGHQHHLGPRRQRRAERRQRLPRGGQRVPERPLAQLQHVAEQHHPLDAGDRLEQRPARPVGRQRGPARGAAEMQIGDDQRAQVVALDDGVRALARVRPQAASAWRIALGSMKRTSSETTSSSRTSAVPRARNSSTRRWTSSSGALAPELIPTIRLPSSHSSSSWPSLSIRCESAPFSRATSTRRLEFDELREPITSTRSDWRASSLTAAWRLVVA